MALQIFLFRGINVGTAKRVPMAGLRSLAEDLGFTEVRTLLNSGNLVLQASGGTPARNAARIREALRDSLGVDANVLGLGGAQFRAIRAANPLPVPDPSRFLVAFIESPALMTGLAGLATRDWGGESLVAGPRAAYLWCPGGVLESPLLKALNRAFGDQATTRNWATVEKLAGMTG